MENKDIPLCMLRHIVVVENDANTYTQYVYLLEFKLRPQYIHLFNCLKEINLEFDFQKQSQIPPPPGHIVCYGLHP